MSSRYTVLFLACALPLVLVGQIAPSMAHELDFWLLWVVAMTLVGLPILFAEFALSVRSGDLPYQGIQKLTREADAGVSWRVFAGLSIALAMLIATHLTARIGVGVHTYLPHLNVPMPSVGISVVALGMAMIVSFAGSKILRAGVPALVIGAGLSLFDAGADSGVVVPVMTSISLGEWAKAVSLALVCLGVGSGLYWFGSSPSASAIDSKKPLSGMIVPVWLGQLIFGAFALLASSAFVTPVSFAVSALGMVFVSAVLIHYAGTQLIYRFGMIKGMVATLIALLALAVIPPKWSLMAVIVVSTLAVLALAFFAGFVMKISHLRKTFNFKSEARYNLWRMFVRIFAPLAIVVALVGWVLEWLR